MKKKFVLQNGFGLLPNCIVKKRKFCIARLVLYSNRGGLAARRLENCIAIQLLYCRQEKARLENLVLQYSIIL